MTIGEDGDRPRGLHGSYTSRFEQTHACQQKKYQYQTPQFFRIQNTFSSLTSLGMRR